MPPLNVAWRTYLDASTPAYLGDRYWAGVSPKVHGTVVKTPQPVPGIVEVDPSIVWNPQTLTGASAAALPASFALRCICLKPCQCLGLPGLECLVAAAFQLWSLL